MTEAPTVKIQKLLAATGQFGSRRRVEELVSAGRVVINGEIAHQGQRVVRSDVVEVDRKVVATPQSSLPTRIIIMNKASGEVVSRSDERHRTNVFDHLPGLKNGRWMSIGRLDIATSGLLLFSNNGELVHRLMHPSTGLDREYAVRVFGQLTDEVQQQLLDGLEVEGEWLQFSDIQYYGGRGSNHWYHLVLLAGRNREIRRLIQHVGCKVSRLKRVRYGPVILPNGLRKGQFREMQATDVDTICRWLKIESYTRSRPSKQSTERETSLIPYPGIE